MTAKSGHPARERSRVRATGTRSSGHLASCPAGTRGALLDVTEGLASSSQESRPRWSWCPPREGWPRALPLRRRGGFGLGSAPAGHPGVVHRSCPATGGSEHSSVAAWSERAGAVGGCVVTDEAGDELADAQTWFSSRTLSAAPSHNWGRGPGVTPSGGRSSSIPPVRGQASRLRTCGVTGKAGGPGGGCRGRRRPAPGRRRDPGVPRGGAGVDQGDPSGAGSQASGAASRADPPAASTASAASAAPRSR